MLAVTITFVDIIIRGGFILKQQVNAIKLIFIALVLALVLILAACGANEGAGEETKNTNSTNNEQGQTDAPKEDIELTVMFQKGDGDGPDPLHDWMQENISLYEEKNPHVSFEIIANTCCDNYLTVVTTEMAANNLPDIFQGWTLERMRPFAESGRLYDLSEDIASYPDWSEKMSPEAMKATTFEGGVYGLPLEQAVEVVYYNKAVFAENGLEIPETYDDFLNIIDVLKEAGITPMTVPNNQPWVGTIPYMMIFDRIAGLEKYESNIMRGEGSWTDEPFIEAGNMLKDLIDRGAFDENVNSIGTKEGEIKLAEGQAGMYANGSWSVPKLIELMGDNVGFFQFPNIEGGKGNSNNWLVLPNSALSVNANSEHPEEAIEFLKFVFSQERQLEFAKKGYLTAYKTETQAGDVPQLNQEILNALKESEGYAYPWDVPLGVFMGAELNNATQSIYTGVSPQEAFERLQQTAENHAE